MGASHLVLLPASVCRRAQPSRCSRGADEVRGSHLGVLGVIRPCSQCQPSQAAGDTICTKAPMAWYRWKWHAAIVLALPCNVLPCPLSSHTYPAEPAGCHTYPPTHFLFHIHAHTHTHTGRRGHTYTQTTHMSNPPTSLPFQLLIPRTARPRPGGSRNMTATIRSCAITDRCASRWGLPVPRRRSKNYYDAPGLPAPARSG